MRYLDMALVARVVVVGHARYDYAADAGQRSAVRGAGAALGRGRAVTDLQPPWFHLRYEPGTPLGGIFTRA